MPTVNDVLAEEAIRQQHDTIRYSNGQVHRLIALLNRTDADLMAQLQAALDRGASQTTVQQIDAMLYSVRALNVAAYHAVGLALTQTLTEFAGYESAKQIVMIHSALPAEVRIVVDLQKVTGNQVYAAAMARPFQGRLLNEWMDGLQADRAAKIRDAVRIGYTENQTSEQIIRRIKGTKAAGYADGLLDKPRRDLETVIRSAISHTANVARDNVATANADIIKATAWLATLDTHTTLGCALRDGKQYTTDTHKPIGHALPWDGGPGRRHFNCRSTSTFVLVDWKELGLTAPSASTRASMTGQVPADMTYSDWLAKQPMSVVEDVLGPMRARLYKKGGLGLAKFSNNKGLTYTLDELRAKYADAFKAAGL